MPIIISQASWHAKLYKWFYRVWTKLPKSLCSYFWRLMLAILLVVPVIIISLPAYSIILLFRDKRNWIRDTRKANRFEQSSVGLLLYGCIWAGYHAMWALIHKMAGTHISGQEEWGLIIICISTIMMLLITLDDYIRCLKDEKREKLYEEWRKIPSELYFTDWMLNRRLQEKYRRKSPKNWLIVLAIKAWYEKKCPLIEWKD